MNTPREKCECEPYDLHYCKFCFDKLTIPAPTADAVTLNEIRNTNGDTTACVTNPAPMPQGKKQLRVICNSCGDKWTEEHECKPEAEESPKKWWAVIDGSVKNGGYIYSVKPPLSHLYAIPFVEAHQYEKLEEVLRDTATAWDNSTATVLKLERERDESKGNHKLYVQCKIEEIAELRHQNEEMRSALENVLAKVEQYASSGCIEAHYIQDDEDCLAEVCDRAQSLLAKTKAAKE